MTEATENAQGDAENTPRRSLGRRVLGGVGEIAVIIVGALVISTLLRSFVAQMFVIPSGSMENTLQIGDRVLVAKFGGFQRGDVVVFADPGSWLPENTKDPTPVEQTLEFIGVLPNSGEEYLIKRVVGMPGDRVKCCTAEGAVSVNGVALEETSYLYAEAGVQVAPSSVTFDVVVPKDHVFVMGDHRNASADSRCRLDQAGADGNPGSAAFVPTNKVVGAAVAVVAPLDRLATFRVPQTYGTVPAAEESPPDKAVIIEAPPGC